MPRSGQTSKRMAKIASSVLRSKGASRVAKKLAGSVLSQSPNKSKRK